MQTYGPLEAEWDSQELATQMLRKFQAFANKVFAHVIHLKVIMPNVKVFIMIRLGLIYKYKNMLGEQPV